MNLNINLPALTPGGSYRVVLEADKQHELLMQEFIGRQNCSVVSHDGGLISNLNVWENLTLPVYYHGMPQLDELEARIEEILHQCGMNDDVLMAALLGKRPDDLSLYERRLVGFVRAMLDEPELMIYDRIFDGLSHEDMERMAQFDKLFRRYFPFRTSILLSFNQHEEAGISNQHVLHL